MENRCPTGGTMEHHCNRQPATRPVTGALQYGLSVAVLRDSAFLGISVVVVERHHSKELPLLRGVLRNEEREMTACSTHPDCPSHTV